MSKKFDSISWPQKNEPNKCAWEKLFGGRSSEPARSSTVFPLVFIFLKPRRSQTCLKIQKACCHSKWGASLSNTNNNRSKTKLLHHILFSASRQHLVPCASSLFHSFFLYSRHATSIRDWSQNHFLCGCSVPVRVQQVLQTTHDWASSAQRMPYL